MSSLGNMVEFMTEDEKAEYYRIQTQLSNFMCDVADRVLLEKKLREIQRRIQDVQAGEACAEFLKNRQALHRALQQSDGDAIATAVCRLTESAETLRIVAIRIHHICEN